MDVKFGIVGDKGGTIAEKKKTMGLRPRPQTHKHGTVLPHKSREKTD